jgi:hypothetical protein
MIATSSPRVSRCRSMQFAETFSTPSSNHLIETSGYSNVVFLMMVGA